MNLVKCSAAVANTRHDQTGVRRVKIWKGTGRERLLEIDRFGVRLPDPLPPEVAADHELIVEVLPSEKPARLQIDADVTALVEGMPWADLVTAAEQLGVKANGVKKSLVRAAVIAKLADGEKAEAIEKARQQATEKMQAEAKAAAAGRAMAATETNGDLDSDDGDEDPAGAAGTTGETL
jgi:hypothetical protein